MLENAEYSMISIIVQVAFFFWMAIIAGHLLNIIRKRNEKLIATGIKSKQLEIANKELEGLNRMKSEFVSVVSHEIRTPLTTMKEFIALLLDEIPGKINKEQQEFLSIINESINRLTRLINNMLDISRIESGMVELNRREININTLTNEVIKFLQPQADTKDILIKNSLFLDLPAIYGDWDKILQVLTNLIDNAIKFTPQSGRITIEGKMVNNQILLSVIDTGIGINSEDFDKVFEKFQRIESPTPLQAKGTGLGLSISSSIMEMHNGKIWVESELGKGSKFTISLPEYNEGVFFKDVLKKRFNQVMRNQSFLSLIIVTVENNFEDIEAERLLVGVEDVLKETIRETNDVVVRLEGKKAIGILSEIDKRGALIIKDRILNAVNVYKFLTNVGKPITVAIGLGLATYPDDVTTQEELVDKARKIRPASCLP